MVYFKNRKGMSPRIAATKTITGSAIFRPLTRSPSVSTIGRRGGIVVNKATGKFALAHDLRQAFGTRWAARSMPAQFQRLMRHRSAETTMRYFVGFDADQETSGLWRRFGGAI